MDHDFLYSIPQYLNHGWTGTFLGFLGIILAITIYFKSKKKAVPIAQFHRSTVISKKKDVVDDDVEIFYKKKKIDSLYKTNIIFWNNGNDTLYGNAITESDPLIFEFDEKDSVLRYEIIKKTREVNKSEIIRIHENQNKIKLSFDFYDPRDGVHIEFLHTSETDPEVKGTIIGITHGVKILNRKLKHKPNFIINFLRKNPRPDRLIKYIIFLITLLLPIMLLLVELEVIEKNNQPDNNPNSNWIQFIISLVYPVTFGFLLWHERRKYPKSLIK